MKCNTICLLYFYIFASFAHFFLTIYEILYWCNISSYYSHRSYPDGFGVVGYTAYIVEYNLAVGCYYRHSMYHSPCYVACPRIVFQERPVQVEKRGLKK